jgi:hypothetical protein
MNLRHPSTSGETSLFDSGILLCGPNKLDTREALISGGMGALAKLSLLWPHMSLFREGTGIIFEHWRQLSAAVSRT